MAGPINVSSASNPAVAATEGPVVASEVQSAAPAPGTAAEPAKLGDGAVVSAGPDSPKLPTSDKPFNVGEYVLDRIQKAEDSIRLRKELEMAQMITNLKKSEHDANKSVVNNYNPPL